MPELIQEHTFYKEDHYWATEDDDLDCNLCTIGYALIVAATFNDEFQDFSKQVHDEKLEPDFTIFEVPIDALDREIHFTKNTTNLVIQHIYTDYMNYTRGTEYTIEKNHFYDLLKEVITIIKNGGNQFTLVEEKNDLYSIIK